MEVAAAVMAAFAFVTGYVGSAGAPFCGSLGTCLALAIDRGIDGFEPAALIPGVIGAVLFAAAVYVLFLIVYGVRNALHPKQPAEDDKSHPAQPTPTVRNGPRQWPKPTPLLVAVGAALAWGVLSVGPATLRDDLGYLIPKDTVTAPSCPIGSKVQGPKCATFVPSDVPQTGGLIDWSALGTVSQSDPGCPTLMLEFEPPVLEADGMCHDRSGGDIEYAGGLSAPRRAATASDIGR